ncbi:MAG: acetate uptake transporter [Candidatus Dormibacteraeota bacterium]|uniref:Acetate uptake transporter n=1 Tax=Candidatus Amunia macphersoniae TaxID=3127014 RepID=A0A934NHA5_9BACT|nr:acetate uptake transporter [Candidatus Dormibacteraeota bacterium]
MSRAFEDTALRTPEQPAALIADPAPLGLGAFGITTLVLSLVNAQILPKAVEVGVMSLALTFGGLAQLLAGMWAFRRGNTFAATAFSAFGAFWLSFYLLVVVFIPQMKAAAPADIGNFVGWYLLAWGIFTAYMTIASLAGARAVQAVFVLLTATFVLLAIGSFATSTGITQIGGIVGILTAAAAIYASFADVTNATFKRRVLPT